MSESGINPNQHEQHNKSLELDPHTQELLRQMAEKGKEAKSDHEQTKNEKLDQFRAEVDAKANTSDELLAQHTKEEAPAEQVRSIGKDVRALKLQRTLTSIQKQESIPERLLSKVVHNSAVDAVSGVAEKTVARPSGVLTGSIFALIGSSTFLYFARQNGFEYNFLVFFMFFVGGFVLGLVIELVIRIVKKPKN